MHFRVQMKTDWVQSDRMSKEVGPEQQDSFALSYTGSANPTSVSLVSPRPALLNQILIRADFSSQAMASYRIIRCERPDQTNLQDRIAGTVADLKFRTSKNKTETVCIAGRTSNNSLNLTVTAN